MVEEKLKIVVATKNKGKLKEMLAAFGGLPLELLPLSDFGETPDAVEDGATFEENAVIKAKFYAAFLGLPCLADDSGLTVEALDGAPGVLSARYSGHHGSDADNNAHLIAELKRVGVTASNGAYECVLAFAVPEAAAAKAFDAAKYPAVVLTASGSCAGTVRLTPKGMGGFGYDPYFYFDGEKTMAELTVEEKDAVSHRGAALRAMRPKLEEYLRKC